MPVVEEQRCPEHVAAVKAVLFHILPQMVHLLFLHRYDPRLATFPEESYRVRLAFDADKFNSQISYFLYSRPGVIHE